MTGSFNWTYAAGSHNQENLAIIDNSYYTTKYTAEFDRLWVEFAKQEVTSEVAAAAKIQSHYKKTQPKRESKKNDKPLTTTSNGWGF